MHRYLTGSYLQEESPEGVIDDPVMVDVQLFSVGSVAGSVVGSMAVLLSWPIFMIVLY